MLRKLISLFVLVSLLSMSVTQAFALKIQDKDTMAKGIKLQGKAAEALKIVEQIANGSDILVNFDSSINYGTDSSTDPGTITPQWKSGGNLHTHQYIVARGLNVLLPNDGYNYILNWYINMDPNLNVMSYADWPDANETFSGTMIGHFYWDGQTGTTAADKFEYWYTSALYSADDGDWTAAFQSLGKALHYAGDMSCPVHTVAAGYGAITPVNHSLYESHADTYRANYKATSSDLYSTFYGLNLLDISNTMRDASASAYVDVTNMTLEEQYTWLDWSIGQALPQAQKNIAAILYSFYRDTP